MRPGAVKNALICWILCLWAAGAAADEIHVRYKSVNVIYLDAGSGSGLAVGDTLIVFDDSTEIASIEVISAATNSASCKILNFRKTITIGNVVRKSGYAEEEIDQTSVNQENPVDTLKSEPFSYKKDSTAGKNSTAIRGSAAFQHYYWNDTKESDLDYIRPGFSLNFKIDRLFGGDYSLNLRSSARYTKRNISRNISVPKNEWRNRFYDLSFGNLSDKRKYSFSLGRIAGRRISGIGFIDGLIVQAKVASKIIFGAFGGTQPQWQYSKFQTSITKYGAYLSYSAGEFESRKYEFTFAGAGEYHEGTVNREFIYLQNDYRISESMDIIQRAEIDINRGWRKDVTGKSLGLSDFYISARYRIIKSLTMNLSLDSRENYRTYETSSVADSLFEENLRRGARIDFSFRASSKNSLSAGFGIYKRKTDPQPTYSGTASFNRFGLFGQRDFAGLFLSGYSNLFSQGLTITTNLGRYLKAGDYLGLVHNLYYYSVKSGNLSRVNQSLRIENRSYLFSSIYLSSSYEYNFGDDVSGHRIVIEAGYRF